MKIEKFRDVTFVINKKDGRTKKGWKQVSKFDVTICMSNEEYTEILRQQYPADRYTILAYDTYTMVRNLISGEQVKERTDTPYTLSVASETYWCS